MRSWHWALVALVVRGVLVAVAMAAGGATRLAEQRPDQYLALADAMATTGRFELDGTPELFRTPGYPALLVPAVLAGHPHRILIAAQILVGALTVGLVHQLARRITGDERAGNAAALAATLDPVLSYWVTMPVGETLFTALTTGGVWAIVGWLGDPRVRSSVAIGALLAAATYVRPIAYGLPVVAALVMLACGRVRWTREALRSAVLVVVVFAALVAPWHLRNWHAAGYAGFSTLVDRALFLSAGAAVAAREQGVPFTELREEWRTRERATWQAGRRDVSADYGRMRAEGLALVGRAPLTYARVHAEGVVRTLLEPGAADVLRLFGRYPDSGGLLAAAHEHGTWATLAVVLRSRPDLFWLTLLLGAWIAVVLLGAAAGTLLLWMAGRRDIVVLLLLFGAYFLVLSGGAHGISRFRHPIMPIACVLAGAGLKRGKVRTGA